MKDTMNTYIIEMANGVTFEMQSPVNSDQTEFLIDNYYKGRIIRLWINGVQWQEPTE